MGKHNAMIQAADYLKHNIESGVWEIGKKIPGEHQLTARLGVSRGSVRLAVQQLVAVGVLESFQGKGTFVKHNNLSQMFGSGSITPEDCRDLKMVLGFRKTVEPECCRLAALHATDELIRRLQGHLDGMMAHTADSETFVREDTAFHSEISRACGNPLLAGSLEEVFRQTCNNHRQMNRVLGRRDGIYYHTIILKSIVNRDSKAASRLMLEHLEQGIYSLEKLERGEADYACTD